MLQLMYIYLCVLFGFGQAASPDGENTASFMSLNVSTAEGDTYSVDIGSEQTDGNEIVHSTMNGNGSQTVVTNHTLNIRVIIPDSESEDCYFTELNEEEQTEHVLEEEDADDVDTVKETDTSQTINATAEKACMYDEDEPKMTEEVRTVVESLCGTRRIRHLTKKVAGCQDIPQGESEQDEDSDETGSEGLVRRKRFWGICPYRCVWIIRRVTYCRRWKPCFFCRWRTCCVTFWYLDYVCGRFC
ncbi:uncharacterized protein [Argopecten irradians]|uniref:uncharacterized protein isoform X1 n=2 Tax=Argopecten irradians TaxID=31199 RepID=UPI003715C581